MEWSEECDKGRMIFAGSYGNRKLRVLKLRINGYMETWN